ncbi:competence ComEA-like helix-hairpin-helix protein [Larkinella arboricola]|uniref:Competence ComEA-like helix-hairpin-helix protein n=1 Tax=Larkinella arboricola TaxID=643671 RepID=A0A327X4E8_LARAB|nr:helix-hairpin-helix domain-containing protein [Larkinella arboricola]RAJ99942.1 competence ComEA-like helix-hairpin-helix protein [Larkinella arboricola]
MKNVVALLRDYFGMSQREARGLFVLLLFTGLLLLLPVVYRLWVPDQIPDTSEADRRQLDSLVALLEADKTGSEDRYENRPGRFEPASVSRKAERFAFDPNAIDAGSWQRLGAPRWLAERIVRYRSKGGRFRKREDLLKIYDFSPDFYAELKPYIQLTTESRTDRPYEHRERYAAKEALDDRPFTARKPASVSNRFSKPVLQPFDINTADTTDLKKLRGIGSKLAGRIIKFREGLGGFVSADQYTEVFGLDSLALEELTKYGRVQSPVKKLAINTATAEELDRHVYLSKRQAEIIVNYRTQHGPFTSPESLRNIRILDARTIERLKPYLEF